MRLTGGIRGRQGFLEDAIAVKRKGNSVFPNMTHKRNHVALRRFGRTKMSACNLSRCIVNEGNQTVRCQIVDKPLVRTSVDLEKFPEKGSTTP